MNASKGKLNQEHKPSSLHPVVGQRFVAKCGYRGVWEWSVDTEPRLADDGSGREFVWATAIKQLKHGSGVYHNRPPGMRVFYLPLPNAPGERPGKPANDL